YSVEISPLALIQIIAFLLREMALAKFHISLYTASVACAPAQRLKSNTAKTSLETKVSIFMIVGNDLYKREDIKGIIRRDLTLLSCSRFKLLLECCFVKEGVIENVEADGSTSEGSSIKALKLKENFDIHDIAEAKRDRFQKNLRNMFAGVGAFSSEEEFLCLRSLFYFFTLTTEEAEKALCLEEIIDNTMDEALNDVAEKIMREDFMPKF
ncbi:hypothetical protein ACJX0J_017835, partial [Zea mays]